VNPLLQFKQTILPLLIVSVLGCFGLSPTVQAGQPFTEDPDSSSNGGVIGNNTLEGDFALHLLTTGKNNTAFGRDAIQFNSTGNDNTAMGAFALDHNNGDRNTATGSSALFADNGQQRQHGHGFFCAQSHWDRL